MSAKLSARPPPVDRALAAAALAACAGPDGGGVAWNPTERVYPS